MGQRVSQDVLGKGQMCCSYQNRTPDISAHRINTVLLFIFIFITHYMLPGLEVEILSLNDERNIMYEAK